MPPSSLQTCFVLLKVLTARGPAHRDTHLRHQAPLHAPRCCQPSTTMLAPTPCHTHTNRLPNLIQNPPHFGRRDADHLSASAEVLLPADAGRFNARGKHHDESPHLTVQPADYLSRPLPCPTKGGARLSTLLILSCLLNLRSHTLKQLLLQH